MLVQPDRKVDETMKGSAAIPWRARALAPLWNRIGALVFRRGKSFHNFRGLRQYKQKFSPHWELRYLACPGGFENTRVLADATALISGGIRGAIAK
jgi:phosphatidylglycerol lysyltransferase